jgi:soluble lytic murein transglycosylase
LRLRACVFLASLIALAAISGPSRAGKAPAPAAPSAAVAAIAAARGGEWTKAYAEAGKSNDPVAAKVVRWLDYTRTPGDRFAPIAAFIDANPDWPLQEVLERRVETALAGEGDDKAALWFKHHPPVSGVGKVRAAELLIKQGKAAEGTAGLRAAWIRSDFSAADERAILARFGASLRPEDHWQRLDQLLWERDTDSARRMLPLVPADQRAVAEARLALIGGSAKPGPVLAKVPEARRGDPGLAFDEVRWDLKKDKYDEAAQLLLAHEDNPGRPAAWWEERMLVARHLLAAGNPDLAYRLVERHSAGYDPAATDAEFLSGYIALRFHKDAPLAFDDFAHILGQTTSPYAKSRAAYWAGQAAAAFGKPDLAAKWYDVGAEHMATFYGQLSAHELGSDAPPHPVAEPRPEPAQTAKFKANELVHAAELFLAAGDRAHAAAFLMKMAAKAKAPLDFAMLAALAERYRHPELAIAVARRAIAAGMPLMMHGYPVTALPPGGKLPEEPLLLAIMRQESSFAPDATSPVGARGLMQLMPATAKLVAGRLQVPFSLPRLTTDGLYNIKLGRSYLERLIDDFGGSYPLAIAAYNAGPGRVRQWLHDFGDPRGKDIRMVDWIEMIPFNETRIYVHRVLENLQVYRGQEGDNPAAFSLVADLAR